MVKQKIACLHYESPVRREPTRHFDRFVMISAGVLLAVLLLSPLFAVLCAAIFGLMP
jgi:hypothetical protein